MTAAWKTGKVIFQASCKYWICRRTSGQLHIILFAVLSHSYILQSFYARREKEAPTAHGCFAFAPPSLTEPSSG
jgi:hypothetical protein